MEVQNELFTSSVEAQNEPFTRRDENQNRTFTSRGGDPKRIIYKQGGGALLVNDSFWAVYKYEPFTSKVKVQNNHLQVGRRSKNEPFTSSAGVQNGPFTSRAEVQKESIHENDFPSHNSLTINHPVVSFLRACANTTKLT